VFRLRALVGHNGPSDPKTSLFVSWLADPEKNGGGALVAFGCYSMLWSIWLRGMPDTVFASMLHLKLEIYPNVEDHATILLNHKEGVSIIEGSWDLPPHPPSGNEIFGLNGSIVMGRTVEMRKAGRGAREPEQIQVNPLPPEGANAAYLVNRLSSKQPLEDMAALDINVRVQEVLEAAKMSVRNGKAITLPLEAKA